MADRLYTQEKVTEIVRDATLIKSNELDHVKTLMERVLRCWAEDLSPRHEKVFREACAYTRDVVHIPVFKCSSDELKRWRRRLRRATACRAAEYTLDEITYELKKRREMKI